MNEATKKTCNMKASNKALTEFIKAYGNKLSDDQLSDLTKIDSVFSSSTLESHEGNKEYSKFKFKLMTCSGIGMDTEIVIRNF